MRGITAIVGVLALAGCDRAARAEAEAMRAQMQAQMQAQEATIAAQQRKLEELEAALKAEREERVRADAAQQQSHAEALPLTPLPVPSPNFNPNCQGGTCVVSRAELEALAADPAALARMMRIVPAMKDGQPIGMKLYAIRSTSPMAALGFKNGDLVEKLGGIALTGADKALEAYALIKTRERFSIEGTRKGAPFELTLEVR